MGIQGDVSPWQVLEGRALEVFPFEGGRDSERTAYINPIFFETLARVRADMEAAFSAPVRMHCSR